MNTAISGLGFQYPKLRVPSLRCESCRVPGISVREAFPAPSMPRVRRLQRSGQCLRYEAGFLAQEEQAEQRKVMVLGQVRRQATGYLHVPRCHISLFADLWARVRVSASSLLCRIPKHICLFPLPLHNCQPTFLIYLFQVAQAFVLTVITMPNIPCRQTVGK